MPSRQIFRLLISAVVGINFGMIQARAQSQISYTQSDQRQFRIREVASVKARADTAYFLMTVQTEKSQLTQAYRDNEKQLQSFMAALVVAGIPREALRVRNFVVTPTNYGRGFNLARNLVITMEHVDSMPHGEFSQWMAQLQDLGARFGSDCITCIGSG
jgi:uncharacterized protein YggE